MTVQEYRDLRSWMVSCVDSFASAANADEREKEYLRAIPKLIALMNAKCKRKSDKDARLVRMSLKRCYDALCEHRQVPFDLALDLGDKADQIEKPTVHLYCIFQD